MYSKGFDQIHASTTDGCPTRDPLPRPAPARQRSLCSGAYAHPSLAALLRCFAVIAVSEHEADDELEESAILVLAVVCSMREEVRLERPPLSRVRRTIDQLTDNEAGTNFCFRKGDLPTLLAAFAFPEDIPRGAASRFEREELFFFVLRRMR